MADHPRSAFRSLNSVLKLLVRRINSSGDIATYNFWRFGLKLPIHAPFWGVFWGAYFPHMTSLNVLTHKRTILRWKHVIWAMQFSVRICASVRPVRRIEKKDRITKKSQKCYISPICGEAPTRPIWPKSCMVGDVHGIITCAKFKIEVFMGYDFTAGRIFDFSIDFCMGLTTVLR